jgi:hypothetical protein
VLVVAAGSATKLVTIAKELQASRNRKLRVKSFAQIKPDRHCSGPEGT